MDYYKMTLLTIFYILNATLLLLHEIESAYEKEWEILKIPGRITFFLILHIPIILILFYGLLEIAKLSLIGFWLGVITGIGGMIPFFVHKIFVKKRAFQFADIQYHYILEHHNRYCNYYPVGASPRLRVSIVSDIGQNFKCTNGG